jgi:hypothetical protein
MEEFSLVFCLEGQEKRSDYTTEFSKADTASPGILLPAETFSFSFIYSIDPPWQTVPSDIEHVKNQMTDSSTIQCSVTYIIIKYKSHIKMTIQQQRKKEPAFPVN